MESSLKKVSDTSMTAVEGRSVPAVERHHSFRQRLLDQPYDEVKMIRHQDVLIETPPEACDDVA